MPKLVLGYWNLRGRAQISRHLLSYTGLQFEEKLYTKETANVWFGTDKQSIGLDFPNLPYLIDEDNEFKITESNAIDNYIIAISEKTELLGKNTEDKARILNINGVITDVGQGVIAHFYNPKHEENRAPLWQKIKPKLQYLQEYLKDRNTCLDYLTLADFRIAEFIGHYVVQVFPEESKAYSFINNVKEHVEGLQQVKAYYERQNAVKQPHLAWFASILY